MRNKEGVCVVNSNEITPQAPSIAGVVNLNFSMSGTVIWIRDSNIYVRTDLLSAQIQVQKV